MTEVVTEKQPFEAPGSAGMLCGYPKTGRTWMRYMLAYAISDEYGLGIDVDMTNFYTVVPNDIAGQAPGQPLFAYEGRVPKVEMSHLPYDTKVHGSKNILFQTRDPRDLLVSHWMHNTNQLQQYDGSLSDFVHDRRYGIGAFVAHLSSWAPHLERDDIITYEEMRPDPFAALKRVVNCFDLGIADQALVKAVKEGAMSRMVTKEIERGIAGQKYNRSDPDARRVRRGKVGGFTEHMTEADEEYIFEVVAGSDILVQRIIAFTGYMSPHRQ